MGREIRHTIEIAASPAVVLILGAPSVRSLIGDRLLIGPSTSAEMRILMAHVNLLETTADELTPGGARAAHDALIELVRGAVTERVDEVEPALAPALADAARSIVERHLADPDLAVDAGPHAARLRAHAAASVRHGR
jgi:AraC family transcriptional regulator, positive regulator of tynA and feaB